MRKPEFERIWAACERVTDEERVDEEIERMMREIKRTEEDAMGGRLLALVLGV